MLGQPDVHAPSETVQHSNRGKMRVLSDSGVLNMQTRIRKTAGRQCSALCAWGNLCMVYTRAPLCFTTTAAKISRHQDSNDRHTLAGRL